MSCIKAVYKTKMSHFQLHIYVLRNSNISGRLKKVGMPGIQSGVHCLHSRVIQTWDDTGIDCKKQQRLGNIYFHRHTRHNHFVRAAKTTIGSIFATRNRNTNFAFFRPA